MARRTVLAAVLASALLLAGIAAGDPGTDKARLDRGSATCATEPRRRRRRKDC